MRKIAAILLLAIFAFNLFGYKLYVAYAEYKAAAYMYNTLLQNEYSNEELITIKKQINLPYYNNTSSYTDVNGEVEINGMIYTYVKYRIYNDCVEMLCLPNSQKTRIKQAKTDYFAAVADVNKNKSEKNKTANNTLKKSLSDFENFTMAITSPSAFIANLKNATAYLNNISTGLITSVKQPPESFATA
jgi:Fic family protein